MKSFKKVIAVIMAVLMMSACFGMFASAETDTALQFGTDGKFKIMLFADSQDDETLAETTTQLMNEALDAYKPDLVIYLGDNTVAGGYDNQAAAIKAVTEPCTSRNVPFAIVFGNHDQENGVDKEDLLALYQQEGCLTYDAVPELHGCGTCNLPILSSDGAKTAFNLWLIDSGSHNEDTGDGGYDYVHEDQLTWYKETAAALKEANGGETVPAMNFQHIVIPEVYETLYNSVPLNLGDATPTYKGVSYSYIPKFTGYTGFIFEPPCPPYVADGQLDSWVETGDVLAAFCGHDHMNSYQVDIKGVENINVPTVGCNSYSNGLTRGVGLITLDENDITNYDYQLIHMYDMALSQGSNISNVDGGQSTFVYRFYKLISEILTSIKNLLGSFSIK